MSKFEYKQNLYLKLLFGNQVHAWGSTLKMSIKRSRVAFQLIFSFYLLKKT